MKNEEILKENNGKRFSVILMNPPYDKDLHLKFLEKTADIADNIVSVQPATFLVNLRKNGKAKKYKELKEKINNHVKSVEIENLNKTFNTGLYVPFTIITIDNKDNYNEIKFNSCGYETVVNNIDDCNLIGSRKLIDSIIEKCGNKDVVSNHLYKPGKDTYNKDNWFIKTTDILYNSMCGGLEEAKRIINSNYDAFSLQTKFGIFERKYLGTLCFANKDGLSKPQNTPPVLNDRGNKPTNKEAISIIGTKEEIENYYNFITNNKLPLFIAIIMTIDQNNNTLDYVPWIVDKKYTDEEIYNKLDINDDEQKLIDYTLKKFERHSPWKIRLMCGPNSISDNEINNFFNKK